MRTFPLLLVFSLISAGAAPAGAGGDEAFPVVLKARYSLIWSGIPVGSMSLTLRQDETRYAARAVTKTTGLVRWFVKHTAVSEVEGELLHDGFRPRHYRSDYTLRKKRSTVDVTFDEDGNVKDITLTPPQRPGERPAIEKALLNGALDPITAFLALAKFRYVPEGQEASLKMFDGKRLSRLAFTLHDVDGGKKRITGRREPLDGFQNDELQDAKKEPPVDFDYLPGPLVPTRISAIVYTGTLAAVLKDYRHSGEARRDR